MENMDRPLISIFQEQADSPAVLQSMRDIATLSGVLSEMGSQRVFDSPAEILRFLRILQLLNEEALGIGDRIPNSDTLYYRYQNRFPDADPPSKKKVAHIVNVLVNNNWLSKQTTGLKMRDLGKRMMDVLIRLANDSLAYYLEDDIGRSLFQARRDAELSEAYDDHGISGGNKIASLIRNVENTILMLKERELELLADRNALPQLQKIHDLMAELQEKLSERFRMFETMDESLILTDLMQRGTTAMSEGTNLSLGMINKYLKFTTMQKTPLSSSIQPDLVRQFIISMFDPPIDSDIPNAYQMFSFMEQGQYEDEAMDGIWIPVKFASPISGSGISEAIDYLENYEPVTEPLSEKEETIEYAAEEGSKDEMDELLGNSNWMLTKSMIQTEKIENYLEKIHKASMEQAVIEATSGEWSDAVNALTALAALVANKKIDIQPDPGDTETKTYEKTWEWMNQQDAKQVITKRKQGEPIDQG
ncbi:hypothetical protein [Heyndrickxia coagulans]|uniref:Uncharacterized protein n=1 Tax=Heyndrickxia coagulans 36D1 TaxID=345219 RepID=G2TK23_HEYCO|nr:hypothetical protein [Heyndrickxia coagulans]AEP01024.1 hypothetical protein Bcoa_1837 [Heyndrickxia coagulans 36D1]UZH05800.1 hypothetical protein ONG97_13085 [Heyndrickxia coagulans]